MAQVPFALSVHHIISSVGADVGFASLIGLALLVLLFFSQARETATLRDRADEAGLRIQELEGELADLADQLAALPAEISVRAASPRAAAAFGAAQPDATVAAGAGWSLPPAAPAGVAAPALAAATRLIPDPVRPLPEYAPASSPGNGNGSTARPVVAASAATMHRWRRRRPARRARSPLRRGPERVAPVGRRAAPVPDRAVPPAPASLAPARRARAHRCARHRAARGGAWSWVRSSRWARWRRSSSA